MKATLKVLLIFLLLGSCSWDGNYKVLKKDISKSKSDESLFSLVPSNVSAVHFSNDVEETSDLNFLNFANIYNGGGVATGDFNNDGLADVFFVSNQNSNKLYLNKGDFKFEDITQKAGIDDPTGWSTGVSTVDINNDGW